METLLWDMKEEGESQLSTFVCDFKVIDENVKDCEVGTVLYIL